MLFCVIDQDKVVHSWKEEYKLFNFFPNKKKMKTFV